MKPESGLSNSWINMIPPKTASEERNKATTVVRFARGIAKGTSKI
jgi:hypothetical protein